jgi:hypothetical protein
VASTVIQSTLRSLLTTELATSGLNIEDILSKVMKSLAYLDELEPEIAGIVRGCYGKAINKALFTISAVIFVALVPVSRIRGDRTKREN